MQGGLASKVNTIVGLVFMLIGGRVSLRSGFLSASLLNLVGFLVCVWLSLSDTIILPLMLLGGGGFSSMHHDYYMAAGAGVCDGGHA